MRTMVRMGWCAWRGCAGGMCGCAGVYGPACMAWMCRWYVWAWRCAWAGMHGVDAPVVCMGMWVCMGWDACRGCDRGMYGCGGGSTQQVSPWAVVVYYAEAVWGDRGPVAGALPSHMVGGLSVVRVTWKLGEHVVVLAIRRRQGMCIVDGGGNEMAAAARWRRARAPSSCICACAQVRRCVGVRMCLRARA